MYLVANLQLLLACVSSSDTPQISITESWMMRHGSGMHDSGAAFAAGYFLGTD